MQRFENLLSKVSQALERAGIPYMVIGGQAVLVHGEPRFTRDIDITLGIDTDKAESIRSIARELLLKPGEEATDDFVKRNAVLPVEDDESGIGVDFIFSSSRTSGRQSSERNRFMWEVRPFNLPQPRTPLFTNSSRGGPGILKT